MDICYMVSNLPNRSTAYGSTAWLEDPLHYPSYAKVFRALSPTSIFEIGTFLGYSLATAAATLPGLRLATWVDDESGLPGSNVMAYENIAAARDYTFPELIPPGLGFWRSLEEAGPTPLHCEGFPLRVDLVHVDGDHRYDPVVRDLHYAYGLRPKFIIGHDLNLAGSGVRKAVEDVFGRQNYDWLEVQNLTHGLFVVPFAMNIADTRHALEREGLIIP